MDATEGQLWSWLVGSVVGALCIVVHFSLMREIAKQTKRSADAIEGLQSTIAAAEAWKRAAKTP